MSVCCVCWITLHTQVWMSDFAVVDPPHTSSYSWLLRALDRSGRRRATFVPLAVFVVAQPFATLLARPSFGPSASLDPAVFLLWLFLGDQALSAVVCCSCWASSCPRRWALLLFLLFFRREAWCSFPLLRLFWCLMRSHLFGWCCGHLTPLGGAVFPPFRGENTNDLNEIRSHLLWSISGR